MVLTNETIDQDISEYLRLLDERSAEAKVQAFLAAHPYFFNGLTRCGTPLYSRVKFGAEYEADFVFCDPSSYGVEWYFVEIESPASKMFTKKGDPSSPLYHAMEQVRDWQRWIHENLSYVRRLLPLIEYPFAYIFIGRRSELDEKTRPKLRRLNYDNRSIMEIHTLDSFVSMAESVKTLGSWEYSNAFSHAELARKQPPSSFAWLADEHTAFYKERAKHELLEEREEIEEGDAFTG